MFVPHFYLSCFEKKSSFYILYTGMRSSVLCFELAWSKLKSQLFDGIFHCYFFIFQKSFCCALTWLCNHNSCTFVYASYSFHVIQCSSQDGKQNMVLIYPAVVPFFFFLLELNNICLLLFISSDTHSRLCAAAHISGSGAVAWWRAPGADPEEATLQ